MQIKKILVPTELDALSEAAGEFAIQLATQLNADEVILLHQVIPSHAYSYYSSGTPVVSRINLAEIYNQTLFERNQQIIHQRALELSYTGVKVTPIVQFENPDISINQFMHLLGADLIIYGNSDKLSFMELFSANNTIHLLRKLDYPVILFTKETITDTIRKVALAIDIDTPVTGDMDALLYIVHKLNAHLQLVHIVDSDAQRAAMAIDKMQQLAKTKNITNYSINILNNESVEHGLQSFVRKFNPDMIAILSRGSGKLNNIIYGRNSRNIINEMKIPVIVCNS